MNERIRELAGKANIHFSRIGILDGDPDGTARLVDYSKIEKFAELIVRECATKMASEIMNNSWVDDAVKNTYQHFGVE